MKASKTATLVLIPILVLAHNQAYVRPAHQKRQLARLGLADWNRRGVFDGFGGPDDGDGLPSGTAVKSGSTSLPTQPTGPTSAVTTPNNPPTTSPDPSVKPPVTPPTSQQGSSTKDGGPSGITSGIPSSPISGSNSDTHSGSSNANQTGSTPSLTSTNTAAPVSPSAHESIQYTTDANGQTKMITVILTQSATNESPNPATASASSSTAKKGNSSFPTGAIIGISVAVAIVVLALIAFAFWRMKKRSSDEDEAIRWPELNRHGDSDVHHALPARETGKHGFETSLERSLSNTSSVHYVEYPTNDMAATHPPAPMALNGSSFGASSSLEDDHVTNEKLPPSPKPPSHDDHDNYTSLPPPVQSQPVGLGMGDGVMYGMPTAEVEDHYGGAQMTQMGHGVTYQAAGVNPSGSYQNYPDYPAHITRPTHGNY
ncbi:uncharacterized protein L203_101475 [Cryptococcus depauperatus CBS 7841]|uniref:Uncharacterized protein n=1 Tax=Cryptococcus depauperatus CBS 7841 TaxID=1295531 RepID=A0A1E3ITM2_9TREE|nr:hypothetical protein L203_01166 [Cryptococcus depauperatus CBS 7841]